MDPQTSPVVLVTGASSGIGRACALHLGQRGYRVYGTSRRADPDMAVHAGAAAGASAGNAAFSMIQMDVDDGPSVERGIAHILRNEGRLDVVVNNAGIALAGAIEDSDVAEAKALFETNFFGVLRICRAVLPVMRSQGGGHIVNVSSLAGPTPENIARLLERIIEDPSPRLRYAIGPPVERAGAWLKAFIPDRLFEWGVMKYFRLR